MDEYEKLSQIKEQLEKLADEIANLAKLVDKLRECNTSESPPSSHVGNSK